MNAFEKWVAELAAEQILYVLWHMHCAGLQNSDRTTPGMRVSQINEIREKYLTMLRSHCSAIPTAEEIYNGFLTPDSVLKAMEESSAS